MAPEVITLQGASTASDIWSLACTIVELVTGKPPYADILSLSALWRIVEDKEPPIPPSVSPELCDFLALCFAKEPEARPTADELFDHPWLAKNWNAYKVSRLVQMSMWVMLTFTAENQRAGQPAFCASPQRRDAPPLARAVRRVAGLWLAGVLPDGCATGRLLTCAPSQPRPVSDDLATRFGDATQLGLARSTSSVFMEPGDIAAQRFRKHCECSLSLASAVLTPCGCSRWSCSSPPRPATVAVLIRQR